MRKLSGTQAMRDLLCKSHKVGLAPNQGFVLSPKCSSHAEGSTDSILLRVILLLIQGCEEVDTDFAKLAIGVPCQNPDYYWWNWVINPQFLQEIDNRFRGGRNAWFQQLKKLLNNN